LNVNALPARSTAMQKVDDGQEMLCMWLSGSTNCGAVQVSSGELALADLVSELAPLSMPLMAASAAVIVTTRTQTALDLTPAICALPSGSKNGRILQDG
jgi:hypothetical protein